MYVRKDELIAKVRYSCSGSKNLVLCTVEDGVANTSMSLIIPP